MTAGMSDLNAQAIALFPQGTMVRHKETGQVAMVGEHRFRKDGGVRFDLLTDGGHPTRKGIRAGRLLAEWEVVQR